MFLRNEIIQKARENLSPELQLRLVGDWLTSVAQEYVMTYTVADDATAIILFFDSKVDLSNPTKTRVGKAEEIGEFVGRAKDVNKKPLGIKSFVAILNQELQKAYGSAVPNENFVEWQLWDEWRGFAKIKDNQLTIIYRPFYDPADLTTYFFDLALALAYYSKNKGLDERQSVSATRSSVVQPSAIHGSSVVTKRDTVQEVQPVEDTFSPLLTEQAKHLADYISDHRKGNRKADKAVYSPEAIRKEIQRCITFLEQSQSDQAAKKQIPFQLLNAVYEVIYDGQDTTKNDFFIRKNNLRACFWRSLNVETSKLPRSATEKQHVGLLQTVFREYAEKVEDEASKAEVLQQSKLLQIDVSTYYAKQERGWFCRRLGKT